MRDLSTEELLEARSQLAIVQAMRDEIGERNTYVRSAQFQVEKSQPEQMAYLLNTKGMLNGLEHQVKVLQAQVGSEGEANDVGAQIIELAGYLDGNRRSPVR